MFFHLPRWFRPVGAWLLLPLLAAGAGGNPPGTVVLDVRQAKLQGGGIKLEEVDGRVNVGFWTRVEDQVIWSATLPKAGTYLVELEYACIDSCANAEVEIWVGPSLAVFRTRSTGSAWKQYSTASPGAVDVEKPGKVEVRVKPVRKTGSAVMNLRQITLKPAGPPPR